MSSRKTDFHLPEIWNFPPFFTIQPVSNTRDKQLNLWKDLIIDYCVSKNLHSIIPYNFEYFKNSNINRELSTQEIDTVVNFLIHKKHAEWDDESKTNLRVIWKTPETLAGEIYNWAQVNGYTGTVFTIFELHSDEEHMDSGFHGYDPLLIRKALDILEANQKCVIIKGEIPDEDGVKFLGR